MSVPNTFASAISAIPLANLDADFAYYDAAFQIAAGAMEVNYTFRLEDPTDTTKKAEFVMSGITTGTTRQYTMPNASGTLATLANTSQTFLGSTTFAPTTNSGTVTIGATPQTGTLTFGRSTVTQTVDIAVGATTAVSTKTVNIGTTGVSGSTTNINFGSAVSGALVTHIWNAGANSMRFDSNGNLGIGTTSPGGNSVNRVVKAYGSTSSSVQAQSSVTTISMGAGGGEGYVEVTGAYPLEFIVNGSERARLDTSGNLLVGTTTTAYSNTNATAISAAQGYILQNHISGTVSGATYTYFAYNATQIGSITQSGTTAVLYNTSSDYRLKNITGPITTSGAYIDSLRPVEGTWKADGSTFVGLIAHETQEVSRTTVATGTKDGDEMQGMDYSSAEIIANLIAELQSLRARVAQLESK